MAFGGLNYQQCHSLLLHIVSSIFTVTELYAHILTTWAGYKDDDDNDKFEDFGMDDYLFDEEDDDSSLDLRDILPDTAGETFVNPELKTGRNDPCPCGSGKKYKKCCGK